MPEAPSRFAAPTTMPPNAHRAAAELGRPHVRRVFDVAAYAFLSGYFAQVVLAGWSLFNDPERWAWHRELGHSLEILSFVMVTLAFAARIPAPRRRFAIALFVLTIVQTMLAGIGGLIGTLHPVNALMVGFLAYRLAHRV